MDQLRESLNKDYHQIKIDIEKVKNDTVEKCSV